MSEQASTEQLEQLKQVEQMKRQMLGKMLTKEAYERLARVRAVNPTLSAQAELYLLQAYQTGKMGQRITDDKMKEVLKVLSGKQEFRFRRV